MPIHALYPSPLDEVEYFHLSMTAQSLIKLTCYSAVAQIIEDRQIIQAFILSLALYHCDRNQENTK